MEDGMKTQRDRMVHEALRQMPYGLYVVGVRADGELNAMTASWVTQCSFDPPLMLVAVRRPSRTYELVKAGKVFTLNLLDKKERRLIRMLERPARSAGDKLGKVGHVEEDTGAPILRHAFAYVECKVREIYEPGDHALIVGEVVNAVLKGRGESLLCSDLKWHYAG
jgi:flavin reductase (DIM6/NTAB) family NADH-FMN oxidoreductase RutF